MMSSQHRQPPFDANEFIERWLHTSMSNDFHPNSPTDHCTVRTDEHFGRRDPDQNSARRHDNSPDRHNFQKPAILDPTTTEHPSHQLPDDQSANIPDPAAKYARQKRHPTRKDRYNVQEVNKMQPTNPGARRKRRKKSGPELIDHFEAPNIHTQRLTLKPSIGPGLFNKARSSAQVGQRGLPDLIFSEMKFLANKFNLVHTNNTSSVRQPQTVTRNKLPDEGVDPFSSRSIDASSRIRNAPAYTADNPTPPAITSRRDFMNKLSSVHCMLQTPHSRPSNPQEPVQVAPWSFSPVKPMNHRSPRKRPDMLDGNASRLWTSSVADRPETIHPMSSASNQMVKDQVNKMLFGDISSSTQPLKRYLSLEDLFLLASKEAEERPMLVPVLGSPGYPSKSKQLRPPSVGFRRDGDHYRSSVYTDTGSSIQAGREYRRGAQGIIETSGLIAYRPDRATAETQTHHQARYTGQMGLPLSYTRRLGAVDTPELPPLRSPCRLTYGYQCPSIEQTSEMSCCHDIEQDPALGMSPGHDSSNSLDLFDKQLLDTESGEHLEVQVSPHFNTRPRDEEYQRQWTSSQPSIVEPEIGSKLDNHDDYDEAGHPGRSGRQIFPGLETKWAPDIGVLGSPIRTPFRGFDRPHILY
ncbi:hypothetical protein PV10_07769 [Exophiala mesophila]|uniref:Uncharacterized protein n=1 Tax=Exophiala mesophila TaxID=212818 RepID=A0A0D1ZUK6_EXOME|nr:uncharacterized protein PV10_07769 [Exophiala mesophila]KIV90463.1 hypothetical protein PV10_07769 [Exophiala mesophila]